MGRECNNWLFYTLTTCCFFSIASVFRRQYFFVLPDIEITIWPPAIGPFFYHKHFFGWYYCILLSSKMFREHIQLITAVLNNKQFVYLIVPVQSHYISQTGCISYTVFISLIEFIDSELPYPTGRIKNGTWIFSF